MSLRIIKPGFLTTVQDTGRWGFQADGVPVSGAMDEHALMEANVLVGNSERTCGLEITLHGAEFEAEENMLVAVCGGGSKMMIDDRIVPHRRPVHIRKGGIIKFVPSPKGCRSFLSVAGGFHIVKIMNSAATYLPSGFGGIEGRPIKTNDRLPLNTDKSPLSHKIIESLPLGAEIFKTASWGLPVEREFNGNIRVFAGAEWNWFTEETRQRFFNSEFKMLPSSNRMGYRLSGESLQQSEKKELISTSVVRGTIQITPDGGAILLMADAQTTGGYPRIAQVAAVDLCRCAQQRIGGLVRFDSISFAEAEQLLLERHQKFNEMKRGIAIRFGL
jgi:antagonist of KipI